MAGSTRHVTWAAAIAVAVAALVCAALEVPGGLPDYGQPASARGLLAPFGGSDEAWP